MVLCEMCGMQVPLGRNGRCALGHALAPGATPVAPAPPPSQATVAIAGDSSSPEPVVGGEPSLAFAASSVPAARQDRPMPAMPPIPPINGNAALDPAQYPSQAAAPMPEMFVVSGSEKKTLPKPLVAALAFVVAVVGAIGGYKLVGSFTGSSDAEVVASDLKLVGAAARPVRAYAAGESHTYRMQMDMEMSLEGVPQAAGSHRALVDAEMTEKVLSVNDDGTTTVRFSIDRASMTMDGASMPVPGFSGSIDVRVRPDGTIERVNNALGAQLPPGMDEKMFTEQFRPKLPRNVKVGTTWTDKSALGLGSGDMTATVRNTVVELTESEAVVDSAFDMPFRLTEEDFAKMLGGGMGGAEFEISGKAVGKGVMTIHRASGRTTSVDGTMKMTMHIKGGGQSATMVMNIGVKVSEVGHSAKTV